MTRSTILFAGGGTGGHIYPNLAIIERLREMEGFNAQAVELHFLVSQRAIDRQILKPLDLRFTPLVVQYWRGSPVHWPAFIKAWFAARRQVRDVIQSRRVKALVATGGFVSGPAIVEAKKLGVPVALVNLDAVPGKANRRMARHANELFSVYPTEELTGARRIGMPLRRVAIGPKDVAEARRRLSLDPQQHTLLITGGSQGAQYLNQTLIELARRDKVRAALADWQILHVCGPNNEGETRLGYEDAHVAATVEPFCDQMGAAWRAASLAISRAGAGSVAEAWANATPTLFFPYPGHKDEHQRLNALPMVDAGGGVLFRDHSDPVENADHIEAKLLELLRDPAKLTAMSSRLRRSIPLDGAERIAHWVHQQLGASAATAPA